jgi:hypothetical protein
MFATLRYYLFALFLVGGSLLAPVGTLAADFSVVPMAFNLNVEKRDIIEETITLTNTTGQQVRLYASVNEVAVDGSGMVESFVEPSMLDKKVSPTTWVEITRARLELAPGETRAVPFTIRMNPNTEPGEYSVFIGFASASNNPEAVAAIMAGNGQGTLVNLVIDKKQDQFLRFERFSVDRFVTGKGTGQVAYTLINPGKVDVVHGGEAIFYSTKGEEIAAVPLNAEQVAVAKDGSADFTVTVPAHLGIGKYKVYVSVEYGEHMTDSVTDTAFFYVLPLRDLIIVFVVVLALAIGITLYVHRKYDIEMDDHGADPVALYVRKDVSEAREHDIDLKQQQVASAVTETEHE